MKVIGGLLPEIWGYFCRTEQNRNFIGLKSIYKGLLPKQHIKYKTKKLLNTIKLHIHVWNACLPDDIWYEEVVHFKYDLISIKIQHIIVIYIFMKVSHSAMNCHEEFYIHYTKLSFTYSRKHTFYFVCLAQGTPSFFFPCLAYGPRGATLADPLSVGLIIRNIR